MSSIRHLALSIILIFAVSIACTKGLNTGDACDGRVGSSVRVPDAKYCDKYYFCRNGKVSRGYFCFDGRAFDSEKPIIVGGEAVIRTIQICSTYIGSARTCAVIPRVSCG